MLVVRLAKEGKVTVVEPERLPSLLADSGAAIWIEAQKPTGAELANLKQLFGLHDLTVEDLAKRNQRPKIDFYPTYHYLVLHLLEESAGKRIVRREVDIVVGRNWLLSTHEEPLPGLLAQPEAEGRLSEALLRGADFLLYTIVDLVVDSYFPLLDQLSDEVDAIQDRLMKEAGKRDMRPLMNLRRALVAVRRTVAPQREIFSQLVRHDIPFIRREQTLYFQDVYDHHLRILDELDLFRDTVSSVFELFLGTVSNQLNLVMKRLTGWGTIFIVLTLITGIFGMNFRYMPELQWRWGYPAVLLLMSVVAFGLYRYFRKRDYL